MQFEKRTYESYRESLFYGVHKSGLRVFVMPKKGFLKNYAIYATGFGSVNNRFVPLGETEPVTVPDGIAHFLEHKMFEEETGTNIFDEFAKYGANANAFTSSSMTAYLFSATAFFEENLDILLGYVNRPYFTPENIQKEQGIIGQEIGMYDDSPDWQVYIGALKGLYHAHPARVDIAGTVKSIAQIDQKAMYRCYNTYYHPSNMCLVVIGDVDPERVGALVERHLQNKEPAPPVQEFFPEEPKTAYKKRVEKQMDVAKPQFAIVFKDNEAELPGKLRRAVETEILCELIAGESTDFYRALYEEGLLNEEFSVSFEADKSFAFSGFFGESADPNAVQTRLFARIAQLRAQGLNDEEIERIKRLNLGQFLRGFDRAEDFAHAYLSRALLGEDYMTYPEVLASITKEELTKRLDSHFNEEASSMSVVWPRS